ncbi:hypothetical protein DP129_12445 [Clostridium tetani]|uniref:hypothetical protein n=1 Tax=Clostridium tetani TaxID=1513 RepID=UPI00100BC6F8|nr:hypothetical protein [Clostridium tetani]RXI38149.1 hypothetical protein DP129_12445 [Clostridium tetani]
MNKKLKIMSTILCGVLISSGLVTTGVHAKTITNNNSNQISESVKNQTEFQAKIYQEKDGEFIELTDEDLAKMNLKIDRKTLEIRKIRQKRDIEPGSYFEDWKELNHNQVNELIDILNISNVQLSQIQSYLTACGFGSTRPVFMAAKVIMSLGKTGLRTADKGNGVIIRRLNTNYQVITIVPR